MVHGSMIWNFVNSMPQVYRGSPLVPSLYTCTWNFKSNPRFVCTFTPFIDSPISRLYTCVVCSLLAAKNAALWLSRRPPPNRISEMDGEKERRRRHRRRFRSGDRKVPLLFSSFLLRIRSPIYGLQWGPYIIVSFTAEIGCDFALRDCRYSQIRLMVQVLTSLVLIW